ncbi:MAG TPA: iron chelate uptake ABC transporter family permease subunit [Ktedonobacteraceae bacterium]|nr:iron chelate uptake ABC transporter family permease subunit [Ktedonobacteraceae bacterium]
MMQKSSLSSLLKRIQVLPTWITLPSLVLLLLAALLLGVSFGSTAIPFGAILQVLLNGTGLFHFARQWDPATEIIIWQLRLPLVVGVALVGAALAVAGTLFQAILRNPLADPFLIGTSSGAALGATIAFVIPFAAASAYSEFFPLTSLLAFLGAILTVFVVYLLAHSGGETPVVTLLLAGVVLNAVLVAAQTVLLTFAPAGSQLRGIAAVFNWLSGGVSVTGWSPVILVGGIISFGILLALLLSGVLDAFGLGEESAAYLGLHVERYKLLVIGLASLITAAAVSISGLIGFVGLVTPHILRLILGPRHRLLVPASALGGAIFLILANLLARAILAPNVLPDGVFTALIGAPFFLFLLRKSRRTYRW